MKTPVVKSVPVFLTADELAELIRLCEAEPMIKVAVMLEKLYRAGNQVK